jgi:hypothetical protein
MDKRRNVMIKTQNTFTTTEFFELVHKVINKNFLPLYRPLDLLTLLAMSKDMGFDPFNIIDVDLCFIKADNLYKLFVKKKSNPTIGFLCVYNKNTQELNILKGEEMIS